MSIIIHFLNTGSKEKTPPNFQRESTKKSQVLEWLWTSQQQPWNLWNIETMIFKILDF